MPEMTIRLHRDPETGKQNIVVKLRSDEDALPHEHEQMHRALVDKLINGGILKAGEEGNLVIEREEETAAPNRRAILRRASGRRSGKAANRNLASRWASAPGFFLRGLTPTGSPHSQRPSMIVKFPDLDTLRLALTSGAVPSDVAQKAAVAGFGEPDQLWVETSAKLSAAVQKELKRLGALVCKASDAALSTEVSSWLELLPLVADDSALDKLEQTPVLFDVPGSAELSRLVVEMMRLGNDRQSFRWLEERGDKNGDDGRALLRVVGPPYYSLLRAVDQLGGPGVAPHAFVERAPGVWVELGHAHLLAAHIRPPKGKMLLLRPPRQWLLLPEAPFRDVYEIVEFQLPDGVTPWRDSPLPTRLKVTPRLQQSGPADGAELWVLRGEAHR